LSREDKKFVRHQYEKRKWDEGERENIYIYIYREKEILREM
jgi:hypothetical protein